MTDSVIPDEGVERLASTLHGLEHDRLFSRCPGSDDCQLWYDAEFRAAALLSALPHLRVQETGQVGGYATTGGGTFSASANLPAPRPVDREAVRDLIEAASPDLAAYPDRLDHVVDRILSLLPTEEDTKGEGS